ncbi:MAG: hypothetical protein ISS41_10855 [Candidatus Aminicenantes bacterium]|nr:hypothetical protein [Candidatus Aminicenantes bacterium]
MKNDFKKGFFKALEILKDYLPVIVISGGWAPLVYYHYLLSKKEVEPLRTKDIDIVVPEKLAKRRNRTVDEILAAAGFKTKFKSRHIPPVVSYEGNIEGHDVEIEFLTHLRGSGRNNVVKVQKDLYAQALRYIIVLIENSIKVSINDLKMENGEILEVRVPSPGAFIFQKGLIFVRRTRREKSAKDLYYIFDILSNCQELREKIIKEFHKFKRNYHSRWLSSFVTNLEGYFSDISSEGVYLVLSQRPEGAFPGMNDDQFKQYVFEVFKEFISQIKSL